MKSIEARQSYSSPEKEDGDPGIFELSLEAESAGAEQEFLGTKRSIAEMFIRNPAFKSEKAERALRKLKEALKAAEQNLPEELKNELRHERKDASFGQDPVHISTILADVSSRQPGLASMTPSSSQQDKVDRSEEVSELSQRTSSLYKQAIVAGITAAALIVVVFVLLKTTSFL